MADCSHPYSASELIVIARSNAVLRSAGSSARSVAGVNVSSLDTLLKGSKVSLKPLFDRTEDRSQSTMGATLQRSIGADALPDVSTFYIVEGVPENPRRLIDDLLNEAAIEAAYLKPASEPPQWRDTVPGAPVEAPSNLALASTPDFSRRQGYLDRSPTGVDARFAWTKPGGLGDGIRVIDLEWGWNFSHEDLARNQGGIVGGTASSDTDHGTCVIGAISGHHNGFGVMGIAPNATIEAIALSMGSATAIWMAADRLNRGDVILLEIHRPGPRFAFQSRSDQQGYIGIEWWPDDFAAILYATARGVIVVEAAGNGAENLDDPIYSTRPNGFPQSWRNAFNRGNPQCGAIICGAGAPPPGTHGRDHGNDRSRLKFSNFGDCIDVQGWGKEVTTCGRNRGVADLYDGGQNAWYTDQFSGTSSASAIIAGAAAAVQGMLKAAGRSLLTSVGLRELLRTTGSVQQNESGRPVSERIGNLPNLEAIHGQVIGNTLPAPTLYVR